MNLTPERTTYFATYLVAYRIAYYATYRTTYFATYNFVRWASEKALTREHQA